MTEDLERLRRHHYTTIGLFIAFWVFVVVSIGMIEFTDISDRTRDNLIGTMFGAAIVLSLLQFKQRCPTCGANLGWQLRLGIPRSCHKCGAKLR